MGLRVGEQRGEGKCIYGQGTEIKEKIPLRKGIKNANILLMLSAFITNNPHLLSSIPTSKKKKEKKSLLSAKMKSDSDGVSGVCYSFVLCFVRCCLTLQFVAPCSLYLDIHVQEG